MQLTNKGIIVVNRPEFVSRLRSLVWSKNIVALFKKDGTLGKYQI